MEDAVKDLHRPEEYYESVKVPHRYYDDDESSSDNSEDIIYRYSDLLYLQNYWNELMTEDEDEDELWSDFKINRIINEVISNNNISAKKYFWPQQKHNPNHGNTLLHSWTFPSRDGQDESAETLYFLMSELNEM